MRFALAAILVLLGLYAAALGWLWWRQERLLFAAVPLPATQVLSKAPDIHELGIDVPGARLSALHLKLPQARGVVFYLHGNAGNLETWFVNPEFYRQLGYDLFMIDYRGYGKSTGRIESESQLHADVRLAWDQVAAQYEGRRKVLFGRSLGTGLATRLAADLSAAGASGAAPDLTVLISPYVSLERVAREHFPWVPPQVLRYPLRSDAWIGRIRGPVQILHGELDTVIPVAHSQTLQTLVPGMRLDVIAGASHNDLQNFPAYLDVVAKALRSP